MTDIPPQPVSYYSGPPAMPFAGMRTGSRTLGIISIVLGGLSGCTVLALPFAALAPHTASSSPPRLGQMIGSALVMLAFAGATIWFGIGAFQLRRWARPLAITGGAIWLLTGILSVVALFFTLPKTFAAMNQGPAAAPAPPGLKWFVMGFTAILMLVFGVAVPAIYVWFYKKPEARLMLEYYDPRPRWTDGCPLPVLGLSVALAIFGISRILASPVAIDVFFGFVLSGMPAAALMLGEGGVILWVAWLALRRRPAGWWGSLVLVILWACSWIALLLHPQHVLQMYHQAGLSDRQIAAMGQAGSTAAQLTSGVPTMLFAFGYLAYVRRFFFAGGEQVSTSGA